MPGFFKVFFKIGVDAFNLSSCEGLAQVSAVFVILLFLGVSTLEDFMKKFSHSLDSTH